MSIIVDKTDLVRISVKMDVIKDYDAKAPLNKLGARTIHGAMRDCPVKTGRLRSSLMYEVDGNTCEMGTNVEYAPYVEFGTYIQEAQPYLYPNFNAAMTQFEEDVKEDINAKLKNLSGN